MARKVTVTFTQKGIEHLRDLMSVKIMTPDGPLEISKELARIESRDKEETRVWNSIVKTCDKAKIVIGDTAPDHIVYMSGASPMTVYKVV